MLKRLWAWLFPKRPDPNELPTIWKPYQVETIPARTEVIQGHPVSFPTYSRYRIPLGDAFSKAIDLKLAIAKTNDYWAQRDLDELTTVLNSQDIFIEFSRPF